MAVRIREGVEISGLADSLPFNSCCFRQFMLNEVLTLPEMSPDMEQPVKIAAVAAIVHTMVVGAPEALSQKVQDRTRFRLFIQGEVAQKLEYASCEPCRGIYIACFKVPFFSYVALPEDYKKGMSVFPSVYIEDIFTVSRDKRSILEDVLLFLDVVAA